jgi:hypothetical protein
MKAIKMILLAGFLVLPITSQAGKPVPLVCDFDWADCSTEITDVGEAIDGAVYSGQKATSNKSNLFAKLAAAEAKLDCGKPADAIDKLEDISDKATAWADAPKPKLEDATGINGAVGAALLCIGGL